MVQQDELDAVIGAVDEEVAWMRVAVHVALHEDHLAVQPPQVSRDLQQDAIIQTKEICASRETWHSRSLVLNPHVSCLFPEPID